MTEGAVTKKRKFPLFWASMACAVLALAVCCALPLWQCLVLTNLNNGQIRFAAPIADEEVFSVSFTHSVNKSDVEEFYQVREDAIFVTALHYSSFGAGMPQDPREEGATSVRWEDGKIIAEGYDLEIERLVFNVARIADIILHYRGQSIHLDQIDAPGEPLHFQIKRCSLFCMFSFSICREAKAG